MFKTIKQQDFTQQREFDEFLDCVYEYVTLRTQREALPLGTDQEIYDKILSKETNSGENARSAFNNLIEGFSK